MKPDVQIAFELQTFQDRYSAIYINNCISLSVGQHTTNLNSRYNYNYCHYTDQPTLAG